MLKIFDKKQKKYSIQNNIFKRYFLGIKCNLFFNLNLFLHFFNIKFHFFINLTKKFKYKKLTNQINFYHF